MKPFIGLVLGDALGAAYNGMEGPVRAEPLTSKLTLVSLDGEDLPAGSTTYCTQMAVGIVDALRNGEVLDPVEQLSDLQRRANTNFFPESIPPMWNFEEANTEVNDQFMLLRGAVYGLSSSNITAVLQNMYADIATLTGQWATYACCCNAAMMTHVTVKRTLTFGGDTLEGRKDMEREALHYAGWTPNAWPQRDSVPAMLHQMRKIFVQNGTFPAAMREAIRLGGNTALRCAILGLWYGVMAPRTLHDDLVLLLPIELRLKCEALDAWVAQTLGQVSP